MQVYEEKRESERTKNSGLASTEFSLNDEKSFLEQVRAWDIFCDVRRVSIPFLPEAVPRTMKNMNYFNGNYAIVFALIVSLGL